MIIQALYQRYLDLSSDPESGVSELYFSAGKVSYVLEIGRDGALVNVEDIRDLTGKKPVPRSTVVPEQASRSSGILPYLLCDKAEYLIGFYTVQSNEKDTIKKKSDALRKYVASRALAQTVLAEATNEVAVAVKLFYDNWSPETIRDHPLLQPYCSELDKGTDTIMAFQLQSQSMLAHEDNEIKIAWIQYRENQDAVSEYDAQCLITGLSNVSIARVHDKIKGVRNAQQAGASLVSFNFRSAESYGKDNQQSYNAPVSKIASFGYTTALNHLLASRKNRLWVGDMTVVFWSGLAAAADELESFFAQIVDPSATEKQDTVLNAQLADVMKRIRSDIDLDEAMIPHPGSPFYVLGLSPNNARVAVRFFWTGHFGDMVLKLGAHAIDYSLTGPDVQALTQETPSLYRILEETRRVGNEGTKVGDDAPDRMGGELFRAILQGTAYPYSLYTAILGRVRADGTVNRLRASIIKAYLVRSCRLNGNTKIMEGLTMSLNTETTEPAYRLGRLFSVLERAQEDAARPNKLNSTIKDRFFNAAASNPGTVFPNLIRLSQNHMSKSDFGNLRDGEMADILFDVKDFPTSLTVQQQGLFILGYYHQKQDTFARIKAASDVKKELSVIPFHPLY